MVMKRAYPKTIADTFTAAAILLSASAPASAQVQDNSFSGIRIGATIGILDDDPFGTEVFTYGAEAGYDLAVGRNAIVGLTAEIQDSNDTGRDISIVGRAGAVVGSRVLLYGLAGYTNLRLGGSNESGFRAGIGAELAIGRGYLKLEQRYSKYVDLGDDVGDLDTWQTVLGAGFRF
jgi:outer membrane immunogenic protein